MNSDQAGHMGCNSPLTAAEPFESAQPESPDAGRRRPDVSIVMPCLNEAAALPGCLLRASEALAVLRERHGLSGEIVVADNGSTDASRQIAADCGARVVPVAERGYGAALIGGFRAARGRFLVMGDCDGTYDFAEAVPMVEALAEGADLCMGSRFTGDIKPGAMPWKNRYIGNPTLSLVLRVLFRAHVNDAHCGLRALTSDCFGRLGLTSPGMEFASEMVVKASLLNCRVVEVPVTLWPGAPGRTPHLRPWRDGWRHLRYMLMLSPTWLFLAPALGFGLFGALIFGALLARPDRDMVSIAGIQFGNHWMIAAGAMITVAHQTMLFGVAALVYGIREGYRRPGRFLGRLLRWIRLEHLLVASVVLLVAGLALLSSVLLNWSGSRFGALDAVRQMVGGATLCVLGLQSFFGGFLISITAGNEARLRAAHGKDT